MEVIGTAEALSLTVSDNGAGFDVDGNGAATGLGLISVGERMHPVGGDFMISSSPGNGTRIKARTPLPVVPRPWEAYAPPKPSKQPDKSSLSGDDN